MISIEPTQNIAGHDTSAISRMTFTSTDTVIESQNQAGQINEDILRSLRRQEELIAQIRSLDEDQKVAVAITELDDTIDSAVINIPTADDIATEVDSLQTAPLDTVSDQERLRETRNSQEFEREQSASLLKEYQAQWDIENGLLTENRELLKNILAKTCCVSPGGDSFGKSTQVDLNFSKDKKSTPVDLDKDGKKGGKTSRFKGSGGKIGKVLGTIASLAALDPDTAFALAYDAYDGVKNDGADLLGTVGLSGLFGGDSEEAEALPNVPIVPPELAPVPGAIPDIPTTQPDSPVGGGSGIMDAAIGTAMSAALIASFIPTSNTAATAVSAATPPSSVTTSIARAAAEPVARTGVRAAVKRVIRSSLIKSIAKKIPIVGAIAGAGFALSRLFDGDFVGAGLELGSGVASLLPGAGTAVSIGLDTALIAKDLHTEGVFPTVDEAMTYLGENSDILTDVSDEVAKESESAISKIDGKITESVTPTTVPVTPDSSIDPGTVIDKLGDVSSAPVGVVPSADTVQQLDSNFKSPTLAKDITPDTTKPERSTSTVPDREKVFLGDSTAPVRSPFSVSRKDIVENISETGELTRSVTIGGKSYPLNISDMSDRGQVRLALKKARMRAKVDAVRNTGMSSGEFQYGQIVLPTDSSTVDSVESSTDNGILNESSIGLPPVSVNQVHERSNLLRSISNKETFNNFVGDSPVSMAQISDISTEHNERIVDSRFLQSIADGAASSPIAAPLSRTLETRKAGTLEETIVNDTWEDVGNKINSTLEKLSNQLDKDPKNPITRSSQQTSNVSLITLQNTPIQMPDIGLVLINTGLV